SWCRAYLLALSLIILTWRTWGMHTGLPRARDLAAHRRADGAEPAEHAGRHGVLLPQLPGDGVGGALPGPRLGHLLPRRLRLHLHGQHHHPARLVQLGRPNARDDGVLRAVQVLRAGGQPHAGRVDWSRELTDEEAKPFISLSFIDGLEWLKL
uniref:Pectinesterase n=1 Tax=Aegilops tauschii subsp. strangulata TaxID=200361 RepID=A0A452ZKY0_AEGTS